MNVRSEIALESTRQTVSIACGLRSSAGFLGIVCCEVYNRRQSRLRRVVMGDADEKRVGKEAEHRYRSDAQPRTSIEPCEISQLFRCSPVNSKIQFNNGDNYSVNEPIGGSNLIY